MALEILIRQTQLQAVEGFTISDDTGTYDAINNAGGYGAPNELRNDRANYLLVSKNNTSGTRTYLTVPNTTPLSTLLWTLSSTVDGWHQATLLSYQRWDTNQNYVVDDVQYYSVTDKYYVCTSPHSGTAPDSGGGDAVWDEITDHTIIQQGHTNLEVIDLHFLISSRTELDITEELYEIINEDFACNLTVDEAAHPLNLIAMLEGAYSKMLDEKGEQAEEIMLAIAECIE